MLHPVRDTAPLLGYFAACAVLSFFAASCAIAAEPEGATAFHKNVEPILDLYCCTCHNSTLKKGGLVLNELEADAALLENRQLWWKVLKMTRAGLMPPKGKPRPSAQQLETIAQWTKSSVFQIGPKDPDPGRVTIRRLNRVEYNNTIRDLVGVDFHPADDFPADDVGYGFDNNGDVLSMPPVLLEKYLTAAEHILDEAIITLLQDDGRSVRITYVCQPDADVRELERSIEGDSLFNELRAGAIQILHLEDELVPSGRVGPRPLSRSFRAQMESQSDTSRLELTPRGGFRSQGKAENLVIKGDRMGHVGNIENHLSQARLHVGIHLRGS